MGNRAEVIFTNGKKWYSVYTHWNGGPESVYPALEVIFAEKPASAKKAAALYKELFLTFAFDYGPSRGENWCNVSMRSYLSREKAIAVSEMTSRIYIVDVFKGEVVERPDNAFTAEHLSTGNFTAEDFAAEKAEALRHEYSTGQLPIKDRFIFFRDLCRAGKSPQTDKEHDKYVVLLYSGISPKDLLESVLAGGSIQSSSRV